MSLRRAQVKSDNIEQTVILVPMTVMQWGHIIRVLKDHDYKTVAGILERNYQAGVHYYNRKVKEQHAKKEPAY